LDSPKRFHEPIVVIGKEVQSIKTNPTATIKCPKCENNLAITWQVQTRAGDEGATQFFRCTKCIFESILDNYLHLLLRPFFLLFKSA
jgi:DNA-directed RNA polymerase subunit M/transcription elongation factor TFIIS